METQDSALTIQNSNWCFLRMFRYPGLYKMRFSTHSAQCDGLWKTPGNFYVWSIKFWNLFERCSPGSLEALDKKVTHKSSTSVIEQSKQILESMLQGLWFFWHRLYKQGHNKYGNLDVWVTHLGKQPFQKIEVTSLSLIYRSCVTSVADFDGVSRE